MCKRQFGIILKHSSGGRVQAARPCGWPRVAGAAVGELVVPGPRQGGLHTAAVPGAYFDILYINWKNIQASMLTHLGLEKLIHFGFSEMQ